MEEKKHLKLPLKNVFVQLWNYNKPQIRCKIYNNLDD